jgi:hypothetical protein
MTSFFYVVSITFHTIVPALRKCMDTSRRKILLVENAATRAPPAAPLRSDLMPLINFLVLSYTCCSDRHASPYRTFIRRWISVGFTNSILKKKMTECCSFWCMLQAGPPFLHYYYAVVLHSCILLPPVSHSSNHEYHCCQLKRQTICASKFYRNFKVFILLSLLNIYIHTHTHNQANSY